MNSVPSISKFDRRTVFITGLSGQTGSYLAPLFNEESWEVHSLARPNSPENELDSSIIKHFESITNFGTLRSVLDEVNPDIVINLAAISSVAASWSSPTEVGLTNAMAVSEMLDHLHKLGPGQFGPRRFVQASSAEIFGNQNGSVISESSEISPINPYGASKAYAYSLVRMFRTRGIMGSNCILFNHESARRPETFVTRKITKAVAKISLGLQDSLVLGSLDMERDWGWAPDYAQAIYLIATNDVADDFVIATGETHSVEEFVNHAFAAVGISEWSKFVRSDPQFVRPADVKVQRGDSTKIRNELGWRPTVTFEEMIQDMITADLKSLAAEGQSLS